MANYEIIRGEALIFSCSQVCYIRVETESLKGISVHTWIGGHKIKPPTCVKNIDGYFDAEMRMEAQVMEICRIAWFNLLKIRSENI